MKDQAQVVMGTLLHFSDSSSDKAYYLRLVMEKDGTYSVIADFGRRPTLSQYDVKVGNTPSFQKAQRAFSKTLGEKLSKGYIVAGPGPWWPEPGRQQNAFWPKKPNFHDSLEILIHAMEAPPALH